MKSDRFKSPWCPPVHTLGYARAMGGGGPANPPNPRCSSGRHGHKGCAPLPEADAMVSGRCHHPSVLQEASSRLERYRGSAFSYCSGPGSGSHADWHVRPRCCVVVRSSGADSGRGPRLSARRRDAAAATGGDARDACQCRVVRRRRDTTAGFAVPVTTGW